MSWNPKSLSPYVTNLELWSLMALGFVLGRWGKQLGLWLFALMFGSAWAVYWWRGHCGLDQWPNPYGRYYREWLAIKDGGGDYYPWLATRMDGRAPWRDWADLSRRFR